MTKKLPKYALAPVAKVKVGTRVITDAGFTCIGNRQTRIVKAREDGELYISCGQGEHGLEGQLDRAGRNYVGLWIAP